jgi:hypothetical protein
MASRNTTTLAPSGRPPDLKPLASLASLAVTVLNEHTNAAGLCAVCGCRWPCERVVLAEHNYDLAAS